MKTKAELRAERLEISSITKQIVSLVNEHNQLSKPLARENIYLNDYFYWYQNGVIVGCLRLLKYNFYLWELSHLCVNPDYRRQGVANFLCNEAESFARTRSFSGAKLLATTRENNEAMHLLLNSRKYNVINSFVYNKTGNTLLAWEKCL